MRRAHTVVLGGGLAGLSAAWALAERGHDDFVVIERDAVPGGLIRTARSDRFEIDHLPHIFFSRDPEAARLFRELIPDCLEQEARLGVFARGRFIDYPFQLHVHQLDHTARLACLEGYLEALTSDRSRGDEDFEGFLVARFGRAMVEMLFRPYNEKLWRVRLDELASDWVGDKIDSVDRADMARSFLGPGPGPRRSFGPHARFLYPAHGGIQRLAEALVDRVGGAHIHTSTVVQRVDVRSRVVETSAGRFGYERLIWTLPLDAVASLTGIASEAASRLRSTQVAAIHLAAYDLRLPDRHWIYVVDRPSSLYRITRVDRIDPRYDDGPLPIIAEVSMAPRAPVGTELVQRVIGDLVDAGMVARGADVEHLGTFVYAPAYVVHDHARPAAVDRIHGELLHHGILTAGRFGHWRFYNMDRTLLSGREAAQQIVGRESDCTRP